MKNQKMQIKWNSKISGVYAWVNCVNNKMYIGKTSNLYKRIYNEMNGFKNRKHQNLKKLFNAIKKYGLNNFFVIKLLECPIECLEKIEKLLIEYYDTKKYGYNCTSGGEGMLGHIVSQNQIKKQKEKLKHYWNEDKRKDHSEKMKRWFESQTEDVKINMKSGNSWWLNEECKKRHKENCIKATTAKKIEQQRHSLLEYYKKNINKKAIIIYVKSPTGEIRYVQGAYQFCLDNHIGYKNFKKMLDGKINEYKGWKLKEKRIT